ARSPTDKALLADYSHAEGRSTSYGFLFSSYTLGFVISGPLFGLLIEKVGMRSGFLFVPVFFIVASLIRYRMKRYHM
ncbi:MFS transporter, partial [Candidatus Aerophobetes bacterium]|nr:MFS transporter [Candidatus Aerophobetes bacterium]